MHKIKMLKLPKTISKVPRVLESDTKTGTLSGNVQLRSNTIIVADTQKSTRNTMLKNTSPTLKILSVPYMRTRPSISSHGDE